MFAFQRARGANKVVMAGVFGGLMLGLLAPGQINRPERPSSFAELVGNPDAARDPQPSGDIDGLYGPPMSQIVCKGCGPGIAERMARAYYSVRAWADPDPVYVPLAAQPDFISQADDDRYIVPAEDAPPPFRVTRSVTVETYTPFEDEPASASSASAFYSSEPQADPIEPNG